MAAQLDYATLSEIFRRFHAREPEPKGELEHSNAYTLLVAVALAAQTTDKKVNEVTPALFARASTPEAMSRLEVEEVRATALAALSLVVDVARWYHPGIKRTTPESIAETYGKLALRLVGARKD